MQIRQDPAVKNLLERMPRKISESFNDDQLVHLKSAIGARQWGNHAIDVRKTLGWFSTSYYFVFLAGHNVRTLDRKQQKAQRIFTMTMTALLVMVSTLFGLLIIYLIKSALGINLFDGISLGIWSWFRS